ncbi:MAG TPA: UDP-N-acetylglucosamine--LPS N-acetylglucosamine transferase [Clostridiaceae bacterium]|nr:UDP-N-acetylglucosamine--LPS N-acetylglucosamine transferase [Clostridiaceae bacterium]HBF77255.1 UDP-N-acetylglucosamine--LPS N-acetylglucosamine transferase [Clostridiaceae bacterium]HBG38927.1 UDP-N-acetylglucosamine--LPS N-acetylglucosamine transferase [Clostridiaceae bacterium]HBN29330.1 UDP-N-acetylglucosamine--LPS N-acetylglucosamine transferase [Clostridiaceae bacterium]HBX48250.1 UDP-N-acetylglucosamine--LPS N-acetylglucosamine transferase [Clostridiaceae bacterium]
MTILIFSVSAGKGHNKASETIKSYFEKHYSNVKVIIIDALKYIGPSFDKIVIGSYLIALSKKPIIYDKLYYYSEYKNGITVFTNKLNTLLSVKLKKVINNVKPDVIICTHPFPLEMISILKEKSKINIPLCTIITDYAPHTLWLYDNVDMYIIPNEDFINDLTQKGISKDIIYPYGIPISEEFLKPIDKIKARKELKLDEDAAIVLIMGGGLGMGNIKSIFEKIAFSSLNVQIIVCTGLNNKLKNQLEKIKSSSNKKILIYEYTDNVNLLMSASDILITKPGGLTIAEALIKNIPIIITSAIPGQEERNSNYLLNNGMAVRIRKSSNIVSIVNCLMKNKNKLNSMKEIEKEKAKPNAVEDICKLLMKYKKTCD